MAKNIFAGTYLVIVWKKTDDNPMDVHRTYRTASKADAKENGRNFAKQYCESIFRTEVLQSV